MRLVSFRSQALVVVRRHENIGMGDHIIPDCKTTAAVDDRHDELVC